MERETGGPVLFCPILNPQEVLMGNCSLLVLIPWLVGSVKGRREVQRVALFLFLFFS